MKFWTQDEGHCAILPVPEAVLPAEERLRLCRLYRNKGIYKLRFLLRATPEGLLSELSSPRQFQATTSSFYVFECEKANLSFHWKCTEGTIKWDGKNMVLNSEKLCGDCFLYGETMSLKDCKEVHQKSKLTISQTKRKHATSDIRKKTMSFKRTCADKLCKAPDARIENKTKVTEASKKDKRVCEICKTVGASFASHTEPKKRRWCVTCKPIDAVSTMVTQRCSVCDKRATYNFPGEKTRLWCSTCKPFGSVDVSHAQCVNCKQKAARYNVDQQGPPKWCKECKDEKSVNVTNRAPRCSCGKYATYRVPPSLKKQYCSQCKPKSARLVDTDLCEVCHLKPKRYRRIGQKIRWCSNCKPDDALSGRNASLCQVCGRTEASKNVDPEGPPIWCGKCASSKSVNVKSKKCQICQEKIASFGFVDEKANWCASCKPPTAVDLRSKKCIVCCLKQPVFGLQKNTTPLWCSNCKPLGALDIINKFCETCRLIHASFGLPGGNKVACTQCKTKNMILNPSKRCFFKNCKELATYGTYLRFHCEEHKESHEKNLVENICRGCQLLQILNENGVCYFCDTNSIISNTKPKEREIVNLFKLHNFVFTHDKIANGTECGKERPDFVFDFNTHIVIVEVDENQHRSYPCVCEQSRMVNISQSFGGLPIFWIRYNPDKFKLLNGAEVNPSPHMRHTHLLKWLKYAEANYPRNFCQVVYLFYDGVEEIKSKMEDIKTISML